MKATDVRMSDILEGIGYDSIRIIRVLNRDGVYNEYVRWRVFET